MDMCFYCYKYHPSFQVCDSYIEWLTKQPDNVREKLNPKLTEKDLDDFKDKIKKDQED